MTQSYVDTEPVTPAPGTSVFTLSRLLSAVCGRESLHIIFGEKKSKALSELEPSIYFYLDNKTPNNLESRVYFTKCPTCPSYLYLQAYKNLLSIDTTKDRGLIRQLSLHFTRALFFRQPRPLPEDALNCHWPLPTGLYTTERER